MAGTTIGPSGVTFPDGSVQASASGFPAGTAMLFKQTAAPAGWTKDTTNNNDAALRIVTGTAGTGGTVAFSSAFVSKSVSGSISNTTATNQNTTAGGSVGVSLSAGGSVSNTTLTTTTMPSHTHLNGLQRSNNSYGTGSNTGTLVGSTLSTGSAGSDGAHGHGFTNPSYSGSFSGSAHSHTQDAHSHTFTGTAIDLAVKYVDIIVATKN